MKIKALLLLALRSVGRNTRRSALTAAAMALGLALLIFSRALADGGHEQWIDSAVRLGTGHVAIQAPEYLETGRLEHRLDASQVARVDSALQDAALEPYIKTWAPRVTVTGLASSAASALPVRIEGVDPEREKVFSTLPDQLTEGEYLQPGDRLHAFIGSDLADRLNLKVGDRFVLTGQTASGDVEGQLMRVSGIFHTGIPEMDEGLVHVPLETVRRWLGVPGAVTSVAVLLTSSRETDRVVRTLRAELDHTKGIRVLGWREASPELDSGVRIDDYGDYVFHTILFAIIALAILNAVMMSVLGRKREFGILQALGLTGAETGWVVLGEGLFLTIASGVAGMVVGLVVTWVFFRHGIDFSSFSSEGWSASGGIINPVIVPVFRVGQLVLSVASILVIGTLSSLYPAFRASKLDVAEAMKFEQ
jgi:putative ABC transport system permease protein